ncbi:hypothetical protein EDB80DRAFT_740101 [Ilyonectria destructans]|nr:hypothetical protein EDB80DRAFT_740101 [Ilyonectria destructans]
MPRLIDPYFPLLLIVLRLKIQCAVHVGASFNCGTACSRLWRPCLIFLGRAPKREFGDVPRLLAGQELRKLGRSLSVISASENPRLLACDSVPLLLPLDSSFATWTEAFESPASTSSVLGKTKRAMSSM